LNRALNLLLIAAIAWSAGVRSDLAYRKRQQERAIMRGEPVRSRTAYNRYVDIGIELRVVVADDVNGEFLLPGKPRLRIVRTHYAGGIYDRRARRIVAASQLRSVFYASEAQAAIALHPDTEPLGQLVYGSEGGGKTEALVLWHLFRWLEHLGERREAGQVAPTFARLEVFLETLRARVPADWFSYRSSARVIRMIDGTRIRLKSTHRQSEKSGSQIQGHGWSWAGMDEAQDSTGQPFDDVESRGRDARIRKVNGEDVSWFKQLRTATAKDTFEWRGARDKLLGSGLWVKRTLRCLESPFVPRKFWEHKKLAMSPREYQRRVLAEDVGPERQLYHTWLRGEAPAFAGNVRMVPLGAVDVTAQVLRPWGDNLELLVGHDPGRLYHVCEFLKAYACPMTAAERRARADAGIPLYDWYIVDEVTDEQKTVEEHVLCVLRRARERWGVNQLNWKGQRGDGPRMLVRADPYSESAVTDKQPDRSVYTTWRKHDVKIMPAAMQTKDDGQAVVARIPKEGRIDMMCSLFCNAAGGRRLFVACNDHGDLAAPKFVEAVETMERDGAGAAEAQRKDKNDLSHWPASAGYALWVLERPRVVKEAA
jgi:hypothetical protein